MAALATDRDASHCIYNIAFTHFLLRLRFFCSLSLSEILQLIHFTEIDNSYILIDKQHVAQMAECRNTKNITDVITIQAMKDNATCQQWGTRRTGQQGHGRQTRGMPGLFLFPRGGSSPHHHALPRLLTITLRAEIRHAFRHAFIDYAAAMPLRFAADIRYAAMITIEPATRAERWLPYRRRHCCCCYAAILLSPLISPLLYAAPPPFATPPLFSPSPPGFLRFHISYCISPFDIIDYCHLVTLRAITMAITPWCFSLRHAPLRRFE